MSFSNSLSVSAPLTDSQCEMVAVCVLFGIQCHSMILLSFGAPLKDLQFEMVAVVLRLASSVMRLLFGVSASLMGANFEMVAVGFRLASRVIQLFSVRRCPTDGFSTRDGGSCSLLGIQCHSDSLCLSVFH